VRILIEQSTETRIRECKIIADTDDEEKHLLAVQDRIIEILGPATVVAMTAEAVDSCVDAGDTEAATDLFATGGC